MRRNILVADDDPDLLDAVAGALELEGAHVQRAHSGAELIQHLADDGPYDLVVTDIAMPWMSGLQVLHSARGAGLRMPVIVMTALRHDSLASRVAALGGDVVLLRKPFELAELRGAVARVLPAA